MEMKKKKNRKRYRRALSKILSRKFTDPLSHRGIKKKEKRKKEERYDLRSR